ncbi:MULTISPECIES: VOC family protein [Sinomonas]|jgi:predicted enzyme related to lactoylglutathione lyase|uniref:VOC family protein n=1 Tax=Sinomonas flava TaxID=496857 RepID=A0ABN3C1P8_9MICC|nr:VOC family protein [Sinomonas sp. R1AF57]ASN51656.1 glyoxalase [Sinomonas sp. R1AF57]
MAKELNNIAIPVTDLDAAKKLYTALLGAEPFADSPYYVGYMAEGVQIGLDPNGHAHGHAGPIAFWKTSDIAAEVATLTAAGAEVLDSPKDVGGGALVAVLKDGDGNLIGLVQG